MPACNIHNDTYFPPGGQCILCLRAGVVKSKQEKEEVKMQDKFVKVKSKKAAYAIKQKDKQKEKVKAINEFVKNNPDKVIKISKKKYNLDKLLIEAQYHISKLAKAVYSKGEKYINCWICNKPVLTRGTTVFNTAHCSHFYPKAMYWMLAYRLENTGLCCKECNIDKPETVPAMRPKMIEWHGEQKIIQLDLDAEKFKIEKNTGIEKEKPDEFFIIASIKDLKNQYNNLNK